MDDGTSDNEDYNQDLVDEVNIIYIGGLIAMDEDSCFNIVDVPEGSSTPMDRALARLHEIMVEIIMECIAGASDALPSPGVNPLEGSPKCSCEKLGLGRRSRLPTLERSKGSSWEPRD